MHKKLKHLLWILLNLYGRIFGRSFFSGFHRVLLAFALHGLGYDNAWKSSFTGEEWFIRRILPKLGVKICLDIGANVGNYSKLLIKSGYEVCAIEPSASSFQELKKMNGVRAFNMAVSNYDGKGWLYFSGERSETATLSGEILGNENVQKEEIQVTTLDSFLAKNKISPDFIKIDVEGFELEVLEGMKTVFPKVIQMEFNIMQLKRRYTLYTLAHMLPEYSFYRLLPRGMIKIDPNKFANNIFIFSNYIAIKNSVQAHDSLE